MSGNQDTPVQPGRSAPALTPGGVTDQLSKLDFPAPANLNLDIPPRSAGSALSPVPDSATSATSIRSNDTGDLSGPEPEYITQARNKNRSESVSEQLSAQLSKMNFPQPERIFGPDEGGNAGAKARKEGVSDEDWAKVKLEDEIPEAVKEPVRMTHSRNTSRAWGQDT